MFYALKKIYYFSNTFSNYFYILLLVLIPQIAMAEIEIVTKTRLMHTEKINVEIKYPYLNQEKINEDIDSWLQQVVDNFITNASTGNELNIDYTITRPSDKAISIIWNVLKYTGGNHGNLDVIVFNYDMNTGQLLELSNIFIDFDKALWCMAQKSYQYFSENLGKMFNEQVVSKGTAPEFDNYGAVALTPAGIRIFFQPLQVAPWSAGSQQVNMRLEELEETKPLKVLWNK